MKTQLMLIEHAEQLRFAVVGSQGELISLHQHPDAADRFRLSSIRTDLETVIVDWL